MTSANPFADDGDSMFLDDVGLEVGGAGDEGDDDDGFLKGPLEPDGAQDTDSLLESGGHGQGARGSGGVGAGAGAVPAASAPGGLCGCMSVTYYRPYFDVDTVDVKERLKMSVSAIVGKRTFLDTVESKPDLFGPFWICATLIFCIGATSNFSSYLSFVPTKDVPKWNYDFTLLTAAASFISGFCIIVPVGLYFVARYLALPLTLVQLLCIYGYAHSIYILAAFVSMMPSIFFSWLTIFVAFSIASSFIGFNLSTFLRGKGVNMGKANSLIGGAVLVHAAFAILLKLYFFKQLAE
eukprot:g211.t1